MYVHTSVVILQYRHSDAPPKGLSSPPRLSFLVVSPPLLAEKQYEHSKTHSIDVVLHGHTNTCIQTS